MKYILLILLLLLPRMWAADPLFPITPAAEDDPAPDSVATEGLSFFILDYGQPGVFGKPKNFWVSSAGRVHTQGFDRRKDGKQDEVRYEYDLTPQQLKELQSRLEALRKDTRVLRERYGHPDEFAPTIAFGMRPRSDLYVREKWNGDLWASFTAVTRMLSDIHRRKTETVQAAYQGLWDVGQAIWEPEGFVACKVITPLGYIGSDGYNAVLDKNNRTEQDAALKRKK